MILKNILKTTLLVLIFIGFSTFFALALAQEAKPSPTSSPVDYIMPYPGILPDNPLFFIKSLRDKVLLMLISDPVRRVEFRQLLADKYTVMGVMLAQQQKPAEAIKAFQKGLMYLNETRSYVLQLPPSTADQIGNVKNKFRDSLLKHEQVIGEILPQFSGEDKKSVQQVLDSTTALRKEFFE